MGLTALACTAALTLGGWLPAGGGSLPSGGRGLLADRAQAQGRQVVAGGPQVRVGEAPVDEAKEKAKAIERARTRLAKDLEVEPATLELEKAEAATWPDAALGCPEEGRFYAQVVTEGYKVILKAGERRYELHVSGSKVVRCDAG